MRVISGSPPASHILSLRPSAEFIIILSADGKKGKRVEEV